MAKYVNLTARQQLNLRTASAMKAAKIMNRMADHACGTLTRVNKATGEREPDSMSISEIRAGEVILRKLVPDLTAVQHVEPDELENLTRFELETRLRDAISKNPKLALISGIDTLIDKSKTVKSIEHD